MAKITPRGPQSNTVTVKTYTGSKIDKPLTWWKADKASDVNNQLLGTAAYLKEQQQYRYRQAALYARLYSNYPLYGWVGSNLTRLSLSSQLPSDRPTLNVIQSCIDTLISRLTQSRPRPVFLTDNSDYRQRNLAKQLNSFINGELYQTEAYTIGECILRDAMILGTGCVKIFKGIDKKVKVERRLLTELLVDPNESMWGDPRQLYEMQLIDREVLIEMFPSHKSQIQNAENAYPDSGGDSAKSISDMVMCVEGWRLPSGPDAKDGRHTISVAGADKPLLDDPYEKDYFPFVFLDYSKRVLGFWGQGLSEQLMGTQSEINKLLQTISASINLVGVPRVFVEDGSKVVKAHLNSQVGAIVTYRGTKPIYEVAPCVPQEIYGQLSRLVEYAYQQSGVSTLAAAAQKPAGLNSGEAIRNYDDLQSDRFASTVRKYDNFYVDLAYQIFYQAQEIAKEDGKYQTVYPNKNGTKQVDLPDIDLVKDSFVIQAFDASSLPRDPAGRLQKITEMIQSGMIDIREGRRLLDFPDLEQVEKLANSSEERIFQYLDKIVDEGEYNPPDPFMDIQLANKLAIQYYNLYVCSKLEEDKAEMLRTFIAQSQDLMQQAMPQPQMMQNPQAQQPQPIAMPQPRPQSELVPFSGVAS